MTANGNPRQTKIFWCLGEALKASSIRQRIFFVFRRGGYCGERR